MSNNAAIEVMQPVSITPMSILEIAVQQGQDIDKLTKLMELQERYEANEARKAYFAAMKLFKDNPPEIRKNGHGHGTARYATLDHACDQIIPALAKVGITHKWRVKAAGGKVTVACVLSHQLGYSDPEPPTMEADADTSGSKNAIQAIGSSLKYLERYTLFAAAGLDDGNADKDGADTGDKGGKLKQEIVGSSLDDIENCRDLVELQRVHNRVCKMAQDADDKTAELQFIKASNARKVEIRANS